MAGNCSEHSPSGPNKDVSAMFRWQIKQCLFGQLTAIGHLTIADHAGGAVEPNERRISDYILWIQGERFIVN